LLTGAGVERDKLILEAFGKTALKYGDWVLIPPYKGSTVSKYTNVELGNSDNYQLYNLKDDPGQRINLVNQEKEKFLELKEIYSESINN
jgi:hypothetical protein